MTVAQRPDLYPTRVLGEAVPRPRTDPSVWGEAPGPLDAEQLKRYESDGYLVLDDLLFAQEVDLYLSELRRLGADPALRASERVILEPESDEVRSVFEVEKVSEIFAELLRSPRLVNIARQVLDSEVYIHQSRVNYKPGFGGAPFHWHSDFETWHSEDGMSRPRAFSVSISLTENHPFNGPLMVMPGTHKTFVPTVGATPQDYHKESLRVAAPSVGSPDRKHLTRMAQEHGIEQITGPAGSAVMFDSNLLHGSNGNLSPFARSNIFIVYNSVENALGAPYAAHAPRPQYLSNREFPYPRGM
ncbi:ectoine hydroxylase [Streptomyces stelliscabiei]|uniref:Ectoine hydroxylase n=1 Tax=Streptomyces stelliscabiei TaxID=146820 RepID=A0A8I0P0S4_9ACTN|nr:ectoine hydroxylase [Streptomyces stelliscabiei]KND24704.1 multidrug DMT transporter permease [Streptomyces stelliscabiei]MBE1593940.1 ectoine hydroxylase [Streptomyces stelliscabiei]MDX2522478.1 ectoine hydroxylase [Streptomyces stelliscabiei]MDX2557926.1 ectoine hydroxylase [Streptomyces stelliscabiei]MDX2617679.1 ectoine hydroxylase [Streptomyces stelliscabiei]